MGIGDWGLGIGDSGSSRYLELDIDYTTGEVTLPTGYALIDSVIPGTYSQTTGYRVDKEIYRMLVDGNYYLVTLPSLVT